MQSLDALADALYEALNFPTGDVQRLEARLREKKAIFVDPFSNKPAPTAPPAQVLQYISERRAALEQLAHLFLIRRSESVNEASACITRFTNELLAEEPFVDRLLVALRTLALGELDEAEKQLKDSMLAQADSHRQAMVGFVSDILFSAFFDVHVLPKHIIGLLRVAKNLSDALKSVPITDYRMGILYKLVLTFIAAVEPSHATVRPADGAVIEGGNSHLVDSAAFSAIKAELDAAWGLPMICTLLRFVYALATPLERASLAGPAPPSLLLGAGAGPDDTPEGMIQSALDKGVLEYTADVLLDHIRRAAAGDTYRTLYVSVLGEAVALFVRRETSRGTASHLVLWRNLEAEVPMRPVPTVSRTPGRGGAPAPVAATKPRLRELLHLLSDLLEEEGAETLSLQFWRDPSLMRFVEDISLNLTTGLVPFLFALLRGLARTPEAAEECHKFLQRPDRPLTWVGIFRSLQRQAERLDPALQSLRPGLSLSAAAAAALSADDARGIVYALGLVERVLSLSSAARGDVLRNTACDALATLFRLLRSAVTHEIKGMVLRTLAAFAPDITAAGRLWLLLEQSQILPTTAPGYGTAAAASAGPLPPAGIVAELEGEARERTFPEIRGFLDLLAALLRYRAPSTLGAPYRPAGIGPYVQFVTDSVLAKALYREYTDPAELWAVVLRCLRVLVPLVSQYAVRADDFEARAEHSRAGRLSGAASAAATAMDLGGGGGGGGGGFNMFGTAPVAEQPEPEAAFVPERPAGFALLTELLSDGPLLHVLFVVLQHAAISLNDGYADAVDSATTQRAAAGGSALAQSALLALRLCSLVFVRQDQFISLARAHSADLPTLSALEQLLVRSSPHAVAIARLVGHSDPAVALAAVRLLAMLAPRMPQLPAILSDKSAAGIVTRAFSKRIETDIVVDSEAAGGDGPDDDGGSLRTATLALLYASLVSREPALGYFLLGVSATAVAPPSAPRGCLRAVLSLLLLESFLRTEPRTYEMCLAIVHALCASAVTGAHVMQMLRMAEPNLLPLLLRYAEIAARPGDWISLNIRMWVLKLIALELHLTAGNLPYHSSAQRLLSLLLGAASVASDEGVALEVLASGAGGMLGGRMAALTALDAAWDVEQSDPPAVGEGVPGWDLDLDSLRRTTSRGVTVIDIAALHARLAALSAQTAAAAEQQQAALSGATGLFGGVAVQAAPAPNEYVAEVLRQATQFNQFNQLFAARFKLLDGWRRAIGTALWDWGKLLEGDGARAALLQVAGAALRKLVSPHARMPLLPQVTECVVAILGHLVQTGGEAALSDEQCAALLRDLLSALVQGNTTQMARGQLYTALLLFLRLAHANTGVAGTAGVLLVVRPAAARLLREAGDALLSVVARDACSGDDVWQAAALAALGALVAADDQGTAAVLLFSRGHLRVIMDIAAGTAHAATAADPAAVSRALHMADVAYSLLLRLAGSGRGTGAELLLQAGIVLLLSASPWLQLAAGVSVEVEGGDGRQLVVPALRLLAAMQTALPQHVELAEQVVQFLSSQDRLIASIVAADAGAVASLRELHALTAVIARLGPHARTLSERPALRQEGLHGPLLLRLRETCHRHLQRFAQLGADSGSGSSGAAAGTASAEVQQLITLIARNALVYLHALAEQGGIVFAPIMAADRTDLVHGAAVGLLVEAVQRALQMLDRSSASLSALAYIVEAGIDILQKHFDLFMSPRKLLAALGVVILRADQADTLRQDALKVLLPVIDRATKATDEMLGRRAHFLVTRATELRETLMQPVQSAVSRSRA